MSIRNLDRLFQPRSIAIIGASAKSGRIGEIVLRNILSGGFSGPVYPVNPKYNALAGKKCFSKVRHIDSSVDLAVICTPPETVPGLIDELGDCGTKAAIVITAGLDKPAGRRNATLKQAMLEAAKPHLLRILGPNCVGMLVPGIALNASFAHANARAGRIAFVSQSGALVTGILDWANARGIGFSKFISVGDSADIDIGDLLDYLASDAQTDAILLYMEDVRHARKFMSAARAAARNKHVIVVKSGRMPEGAKAAASHTGALTGSDDVYDAAIRRAGMLRVLTCDGLFDAVETLARTKKPEGERLAIVTNGGGLGVMATDALIAESGKLAALSATTIDALNQALPATWSRGNPVDIIGDAPIDRYCRTLEALLRDSGVDAILMIHAPTAVVPSTDIARALVPLVKASGKNVLTSWFGGDAVIQAKRIFNDADLPTYDTPEDAVRGFMQIVQYERNQQALMQVPPTSADVRFDRSAAKDLVATVLASGRTMLSEPEAKKLLSFYGIPTVRTKTVATPEEAARAATEIGFPVAVKIISPDISHKSDVGGVMLDVPTADAADAAARAMEMRLKDLMPHARLQGFSVQAMATRANVYELIAGIASDSAFGPIVLFGEGGVAVEVIADRAIGLPPLNRILAHELVSRTRIARQLQGFRNRPPADVDAVCDVLVRLSQMAADLPELAELDINPLLASDKGVICLDARVLLSRTTISPTGVDRFAIRPYPEEWEEWTQWQDAPLLIRPIRPEDGAAHLTFFRSLSSEDIRYRMFITLRQLQPSQLTRLTQIDYDREMAFIATRKTESGEWETLGVARAIADPDNVEAEFAVIVRSDLKGQGLGWLLMTKLIDYCRQRGTQRIVGEALCENWRIAELAQNLGFHVETQPHTQTVALRLDLFPRDMADQDHV